MNQEKHRSRWWKYVRGFVPPVILWSLFAIVLRDPIRDWLRGESGYDEAALREWIDESRVFRETLAGRARDYLRELHEFGKSGGPQEAQIWLKYEALQEHLRAFSTPTKVLTEQMPLFLTLYRLSLRFEVMPRDSLPPVEVVWDSELPRQSSLFRELSYPLDEGIRLSVQYQMHAFNRRQQTEQVNTERFRVVAVLAILGTLAGLTWMILMQRREREIELQRLAARELVSDAERRRLEEELLRREAENRHEEASRRLLEQQLATQAAESHALELKTQLYANIGIMAGSYAHNIKNLLVRPHDLLRRCLDSRSLPDEQRHLLVDVRQTLGMVTDRLQQILKTIRRDPTRAEPGRMDLNALCRDLVATWRDMAKEKWKLDLEGHWHAGSLEIHGDPSHLQQAIENLLFNARDATFEMRNELRDQARANQDDAAKKKHLIDAAAWRGAICMRTIREGEFVLLEVQDNGIGMTADVLKRCREAHFSTKRERGLYDGHSTGMGLGLSFVETVLNASGASMEIETKPRQGALFRARFPGRPSE